jgi:hypothetical protein
MKTQKQTRKNKNNTNTSNKKRGGKRNINKTKKQGGKCGCGKMGIFGGNQHVNSVPAYAVVPINMNNSELPKSSSFTGGKKRKQKKGGGIVDGLTGFNPFSLLSASPNPISGLPDNLSHNKYLDSNVYKQPASNPKFLV